MPAYDPYRSDEKETHSKDVKSDIRDIWHSVSAWTVRTAHGINDETIAHPYFIALAFLVIWAWPHILVLPFWFGKDAYRRIETHTRQVASQITRHTTPRRKRDAFITRYRTIVGARYNPPDSRPPLFGGTPLSDGDFAYEPESTLPVALRIIRWCALAWAAFILGREWYHVIRYGGM